MSRVIKVETRNGRYLLNHR